MEAFLHNFGPMALPSKLVWATMLESLKGLGQISYNIWQVPKNSISQSCLLDMSKSTMAETLLGSIDMSSLFTTCSRKVSCLIQKSHLKNLTYSWCSRMIWNMVLKCKACFSTSTSCIKMSSWNTMTNLSKNNLNTLVINSINTIEPLVSLKAITQNSKWLYLMQKSLLDKTSSRICTWWYLELKPIFENMASLLNWSNKLSLHGNGYLLFTHTLFNFLYSIHMHKLPYF